MLDELLQLAKKKIAIDKTQSWYQGPITYLNGIIDEAEEVKEELKDNNLVHLEDELGDILWAYLCMLEGLQQEGKITSIENIVKRSKKKFSERVDAIDMDDDSKRHDAWCHIKEKQKAQLADEHRKKYH